MVNRTKPDFPDEGRRRFAELIRRQMGNATYREVADQINERIAPKKISYVTIMRQVEMQNYPSPPIIKILSEYLGIPYPKAFAILEGKEVSYTDIASLKTAEDVLEAITKANFSTTEMLRIVSAISNFLSNNGRKQLIDCL